MIHEKRKLKSGQRRTLVSLLASLVCCALDGTGGGVVGACGGLGGRVGHVPEQRVNERQVAGFCYLDLLCSVHFEGLEVLKCGLRV